jgi:hypothetical protein
MTQAALKLSYASTPFLKNPPLGVNSFVKTGLCGCSGRGGRAVQGVDREPRQTPRTAAARKRRTADQASIDLAKLRFGRKHFFD